ncbi:MAG: hypothetical protein IRY87_04545 [Acetobacteraceae bacterium]|nr:hypothetical protein [Acetobacteraceae bacterium]
MPMLTIESGEARGMAAETVPPFHIRHGLPAWPAPSTGDPDEEDEEEEEDDFEEDEDEEDEEEEEEE